MFNKTKRQLFNQLDQKAFISQIKPDDIDIKYFEKATTFISQFERLKIRSNSDIYLFLNHHKYKGSHNILHYLDIYQILRGFNPRMLRIFSDASNSGCLIDIINKYNIQYQNIAKILGVEEHVPINLRKVRIIVQLQAVYSDDNIRYALDFVEKIAQMPMTKEKSRSFSYLFDSVMNSISKIAHEDEVKPIASFTETIRATPNPKMIEVLQKVGLTTLKELKLIATIFKLTSVEVPDLNVRGWNGVHDWFNQDIIKLLNSINDHHNQIVLENVSKVIDKHMVVYPPHKDIKVMTSSTNSTLSFSFVNIRISPFTKLAAGSPFMAAVINEVFINFSSSPISFERIFLSAAGDSVKNIYYEYPVKNDNDYGAKRKIQWLQLYPINYKSEVTTNDRLYTMSENSIKIKVAAVRILSSMIRSTLKRVYEAIPSNNSPINVKEWILASNENYIKGELPKVPESPIEAAVLERNLKDLYGIASVSSLSYGLSSYILDDLLSFGKEAGVISCLKSIVVSSKVLGRSLTESISIAGFSFQFLLEAVQTSVERYLANQNEIIRLFPESIIMQRIVMEQIPKSASVLSALIASIHADVILSKEDAISFIDKMKVSSDDDKIFEQFLILLNEIAINKNDVKRILSESVYNSVVQCIEDIINFWNQVIISLLQSNLKICEDLPSHTMRNSISDALWEKAYDFLTQISDKTVTLAVTNSVVKLEKLMLVFQDKIEIAPAPRELVSALMDMATEELVFNAALYQILYEYVKDDAEKGSDPFDKPFSKYLGERFLFFMLQPLFKKSIETVNQALAFLREQILLAVFKNIQCLKESRLKYFKDVMKIINNSKYGYSVRPLITSLISSALMDESTINAFCSSYLDAKLSKKQIFRRMCVIGKSLWHEAVSTVMTAQIPREPDVVGELISSSYPRIMDNVRASIAYTINEITCQTIDSSLESFFIDAEVFSPNSAEITKATMKLFLSLQMSSVPSTEPIGEMVLDLSSKLNNLTRIKNPETLRKLRVACMNSDIIPDRKDLLLILGKTSFALGGKDQTRLRMKISYERNTAPEDSQYSDDEYYSDDFGLGIRGSGQFHDFSDVSILTNQEESKKEISDEDIIDLQHKYHLPANGWGKDIFAVFTGEFAERVKEIGLEFKPVENLKHYQYSEAYEDAYTEVLEMIPISYVRKYQDVMNSYQQFFYEHPEQSEKLKEIFIRCFDEADRAVTPLYFFIKTRWRSSTL